MRRASTRFALRLLEYHVLALRDQRLDPAALSAFAARLGEREVYPFAQSLPDDPYVVPIIKEPEDESNFGGIWHTDSSYLPEPPEPDAAVRAWSLPKHGGDTLFADMHAAYRGAAAADCGHEIDGMSAQYTASLVHDDGGAYAQVAGAEPQSPPRRARPSPMRFTRWCERIPTAAPRRCTSASRTRAASSVARATKVCRC